MVRRLTDQAFLKRLVHRGSVRKGLSPAKGRSPQHIQWAIGLFSGLSLLALLSPVQAQTPPAAPAASPSPNVETPTRPTLQMGSQGEAVRQLQAMLLLLGFYTGSVDGLYGGSTAIAVADFQETAGLTPDGIMGQASWNRLLPSLAMLSANTAPPEAPAAPADPTVADSPTTEATPANPVAFPTPDAPAPDAPVLDAPDPTPPPAEAEPEAPTPEASPSPTPAAEPPDPAEAEAAEAAEPVDLPILRLGMQGPAVERLQERLKALGFYTGAVDGIFGDATKTAVETAQRNYDLEPDGVVGPVTWAALLR